MKIKFDCMCGAQLSKVSEGDERTYNVGCPDCNARYIATITQIRRGNTETE